MLLCMCGNKTGRSSEGRGEAQEAPRARRLGYKMETELLASKNQGEKKVAVAKAEMGYKAQPVALEDFSKRNRVSTVSYSKTPNTSPVPATCPAGISRTMAR